MNNRIKELAEQAGFELVEYWGKEDMDSLIKFAELIIREFVDQIHGTDIDCLKGKSYYLDKVAEHIENYFEVE